MSGGTQQAQRRENVQQARRTESVSHAPLTGQGARLNESPGARAAQRRAAQLNQGRAPLQFVRGSKKKQKEERQDQHRRQIEVNQAGLEADPVATDVFHEYGDAFRKDDIDPDATGGARGIYIGGARPEDAPIVEDFRHKFNRLESWELYLEKNLPEAYAKARKSLGLDERFDLLAAIKAETKVYKEKFRDLLRLPVDIEEDKDAFIAFVDEQSQRLEVLIDAAEDFSARHGKKSDTEAVHAQSTEDWRGQWLQAVQKVNTLLNGLWPPAEKTLNSWIWGNEAIPEKIKVGKLEYIGSLAKGYKGPPKQHVRFNPKDFDVDANLEAPSLAYYAQRHDGRTPDRERIFGRQTTIRPLIVFADQVQKELVANIDGIADDPHDVFDVAIHAPALITQEENAAGLQCLYDLRTYCAENDSVATPLLIPYQHFIDRLDRARLLTPGQGKALRETVSKATLKGHATAWAQEEWPGAVPAPIQTIIDAL